MSANLILRNAGSIHEDLSLFTIKHTSFYSLWKIFKPAPQTNVQMNKPFPSSLVPLFQNESKCENDFDLHENDSVGGTRFHMNGFALRLVLTRRQKGIRKWPIVERELINITRGWNKEKHLSPRRNRTQEGRSWVRFLPGTQIFFLSHARAMLITSLFTFLYRA